MICDRLPHTGPASPTELIVLVALVCVIAGTLLALGARRRRIALHATLLAVAVMTIALILPAPPAEASASDCTAAGASVQVSQTSTLDGLAPGVAPVPITGLVTNTGTEPVLVTAVDVTITSVTPAHSEAGSCDATDYVLSDTHMPVTQLLAGRRSVSFAGASIGFRNKSTVQDACQGATVHLLYALSGRGD